VNSELGGSELVNSELGSWAAPLSYWSTSQVFRYRGSPLAALAPPRHPPPPPPPPGAAPIPWPQVGRQLPPGPPPLRDLVPRLGVPGLAAF
jgi:hypothetical protein